MKTVYETEGDARRAAEAITRLWEDSDGDDGFNAVAVYSVSRGGWIVIARPHVPGTLT